MVVSRSHQVTQCICGQIFQGENYNKHKKSRQIKGDNSHGRNRRVLYCVECSAFGEGHNRCPYYTLTKGEMLRLIEKKSLSNKAEIIERAEERKKKKAGKKTEGQTPMDIIERAVEAAAIQIPSELETAVATIVPPSTSTPIPAGDITLEDGDSSQFMDWPTAKRVRRLSDTSTEGPAATSSPQPPKNDLKGQYCGTSYDPRSEAAPCSSRVAMSNLVDKVNHHRKLHEDAESRNKELEAKYAKAEEELAKEKERVRLLSLELQEAKKTVEKNEMKKKELETQLEDERKGAEKCIEVVRESLMKKNEVLRVKLAEAEKGKGKERWWLCHMACKDGRIIERNWEDLSDLEKTTICFSNEDRGVHCHHLRLCTYSDFGSFIQNTKWHSKYFMIFSNDSLYLKISFHLYRINLRKPLPRERPNGLFKGHPF